MKTPPWHELKRRVEGSEAHHAALRSRSARNTHSSLSSQSTDLRLHLTSDVIPENSVQAPSATDALGEHGAR